MTVTCECGGALVLINQHYNAETAFERYECESCGRTGSLHIGRETRTTGCVTK